MVWAKLNILCYPVIQNSADKQRQRGLSFRCFNISKFHKEIAVARSPSLKIWQKPDKPDSNVVLQDA